MGCRPRAEHASPARDRAATPAGTPGYGDELSPREREVATLAAEGATNREIALDLFLSPKTVEHYVSAAMRKLGVSSRTALPVPGPAGQNRGITPRASKRCVISIRRPVPDRFSHRRLRAIQLLVGVVAALVLIVAGSNAAQKTAAAPIHSRANKLRTVRLSNGSVARIAANGIGTITRENGSTAALAVPLSQYQTANGLSAEPGDSELAQQVSDQQRGVAAPGNVVVALSVAPTQSTVKRALERVHAGSLKRLFSGKSDATVSHIGSAAQAQLGDSAVVLTNSYVVHVSGDATQAARTLRATPGVNWAEPDWYVSTFDTGAGNRPTQTATTGTGAGGAPSLPSNYGLQSSLESYLNQNGVNAVSAYADARAAVRLPGTGRDDHQHLGRRRDRPTTVAPQRPALPRLPSMPLIPTYAASQRRPRSDSVPVERWIPRSARCSSTSR